MVVGELPLAVELLMIFSMVCLRVRSSSRTCRTRRLARELKPWKELAWVRPSSSLMPLSSANSLERQLVLERRERRG